LNEASKNDSNLCEISEKLSELSMPRELPKPEKSRDFQAKSCENCLSLETSASRQHLQRFFLENLKQKAQTKVFLDQKSVARSFLFSEWSSLNSQFIQIQSKKQSTDSNHRRLPTTSLTLSPHSNSFSLLLDLMQHKNTKKSYQFPRIISPAK
jgi:hypothetical protein